MRSTLPRLLPAKNVAKLLGVSLNSLLADAASGLLPHVTVGGEVLFDYERLEDLLVERANESLAGGRSSR